MDIPCGFQLFILCLYNKVNTLLTILSRPIFLLIYLQAISLKNMTFEDSIETLLVFEHQLTQLYLITRNMTFYCYH